MKLLFLIIYFMYQHYLFASEGAAKTNVNNKINNIGYEDYDEHEEHDDHNHSSVKYGEGKAITHFDPLKGFKLSQQAEIQLSVTKKEIVSDKILISKKALVLSKDKTGVYVFEDGFYKYISVKILESSSDTYLIKLDRIHLKKLLVTSNVQLLKVSDIFARDTAEYGHSH